VQVKTYRTQRGAEAFARKLKDKWPHKLFQVSCSVTLDFRDHWYVEVLVDDVRGKPAWVGCGPLSKGA
jgi:hypothetical protein